jgi:flavin-dependent dehydrogenase
MTYPCAHQAYDCVIIGGGPAGATAAAILADHGRKVLLLEKARFPRHHIGESLMPQTYWTFKRLGILDKLRASAFVPKESVQFINATGKESQPYFFTDRDPNEWSTTWQVDRDQFDQMMLDNAREHGAEICQGVGVKAVRFVGERATGVILADPHAGVEISARVVVDASGTSAVLARQLKAYNMDDRLKNAAIYGYFRNARRDEGRNAGATLVIQLPDGQGWVWFIPLQDEITSIGVVAPPSYLITGRNTAPVDTLMQELMATPGVADRLQDSTRVGEVRVCRDFSYHSDRMSGDGWLLIGDAFGFLDPIYSSGVMLALKSGEWAADAIHDALAAGDVSAERLGQYGARFLAGMELLRKLVYAYYDPNFHFGKFLMTHPEHRDNLVRLLIGDVFVPEVGAIFVDMGTWTNLPEPMRTTGSVTA